VARCNAAASHAAVHPTRHHSPAFLSGALAGFADFKKLKKFQKNIFRGHVSGFTFFVFTEKDIQKFVII
jgi:hypothetical protein